MKMIFIKVGACCETARRAAVSMPEMRKNSSEMSSSAVKEGQSRGVPNRPKRLDKLAYAMLTSAS
jgi:hypothetical protein